MKQFETILSSQEILTKQGQYMIFTTVEKGMPDLTYLIQKTGITL